MEDTDKIGKYSIFVLESSKIEYLTTEWPSNWPTKDTKISGDDVVKTGIITALIRASSMLGVYYPFGYDGRLSKTGSTYQSSVFYTNQIRLMISCSTEFKKFTENYPKFLMEFLHLGNSYIFKVLNHIYFLSNSYIYFF